MNFDLFETAQDHIVITAHRGVSGGNIPCNTITAYEIALKQGADMIEVDLNKSSDGVLIIFHPDMEPNHLGLNRKLPEMTYEEIREIRYRNYDNSTKVEVVLFICNRLSACSLSAWHCM